MSDINEQNIKTLIEEIEKASKELIEVRKTNDIEEIAKILHENKCRLDQIKLIRKAIEDVQ